MKDLLILHGALGSSKQTLALKPHLEPLFNCHFLDFSGHGNAPFQSAFGMEQFKNETLDYIAKNDLNDPAVFGYSMGGYVALMAELSVPNTFSSILSLGTKFDWNPDSSVKEAAMLNPEKIIEKVPAYAQALEAEHGPKWKELCSKTAEMMLELGASPVLNSESLSGIDCKTRIGLGDRDRMVSMDETYAAYSSLPNASMIVFPNTPHPLNKVDLNRLSTAIQEFCLT